MSQRNLCTATFARDTFFSSEVAFGKRSGWVLCNEANQILLMIYGIEQKRGFG